MAAAATAAPTTKAPGATRVGIAATTRRPAVTAIQNTDVPSAARPTSSSSARCVGAHAAVLDSSAT